METNEEAEETNPAEATEAPTQAEEVSSGSEEMVVAGLQVVSNGESDNQVPEENVEQVATTEQNVDAGVESETSSEASNQVPEENVAEATTPANVEESAEQVTGGTDGQEEGQVSVESDRIEGPVVTTKKSEGDSDNQVKLFRKTERLIERMKK